jgi:hypothetical protein
MTATRADVLLLNALHRLAQDHTRVATDPLTPKGEKILKNMEKQYGKEKGEQVLYASKNAGKIKGIDEAASVPGQVDGEDAMTAAERDALNKAQKPNKEGQEWYKRLTSGGRSDKEKSGMSEADLRGMVYG